MCWPGVDVLAKRIRLVFPMVNTFYLFLYFCEGGWVFIFTLSKNDQNSSFLCTCSILTASSCPSNVQNSPLLIKSIYTTKNASLNVSHLPINTYGIKYLGFNLGNYMWDLGSSPSFFSLYKRKK